MKLDAVKGFSVYVSTFYHSEYITLRFVSLTSSCQTSCAPFTSSFTLPNLYNYRKYSKTLLMYISIIK